MTMRGAIRLNPDMLLQTQKCSKCDQKYCLMVMFYLHDKKLGRGTIMCDKCTKEVMPNGR